MSKIDEIKEGNARLRLVYGLSAVIVTALTGWVANQWSSGEWNNVSRCSPEWRVGLGAGAALVYFAILMFLVDMVLLRNIRELGDLQ